MPYWYGYMSSRHDSILGGFLIYLENKMEQFIEFVIFFSLHYKTDISNYPLFYDDSYTETLVCIFHDPIRNQDDLLSMYTFK